MSFDSVTIEVDDTDPRDPNAKCDRCGAVGTIARAVRHTTDQLVLRYCGRCWPATVEEMEKRQHEEPWSRSSRSWYDTRRFLALVRQPGNGGPTATPEIFAEIAADIRARQSEMDGPVPPDIKEFLDRYAP